MSDAVRWSAGLRQVSPCFAPDEPVYLFNVRLSTEGNDFPILDFGDFNHPDQVTGYNVYRSSVASLPQGSWPLVALNAQDENPATASVQWTDSSGDASETGLWFYSVAAYNATCPLEGPQ